MEGRVAALVGPEQVELKTFELPDPAPGAVLLKVRRANVCGSDVHIYHYQSPLLRKAALGHEFVGEVVALGEGVTQDYAGRPVSIGDRVVAPYFQACLRCSSCLRGAFNVCVNAFASWIKLPEEPPHFRGAFATHYYVDPGQYFYSVPDSVSDKAVAGVNCGLSQVMFVLDRVGLSAGETIVIQGAGGLGQYAAAVASERGARAVVVDGVPERLELARRFGATDIIDMRVYPTPADRVAAVQDLTGGGNVVLEVTGVAAAFIEAIELAAPGARIASVGNLNVGPANEVSLAPAVLTRKNVTIHGILRYDPWYLHKAIAFMERTYDCFPFESVAGHDYSLDEVSEALESGAAKRVTRASVVPN